VAEVRSETGVAESSACRIYIMVDSIAASLEQIEQAGGTIITPLTEIGQDMGAVAAFLDPVGNEFGLYEEPKR